MNCKARVSKRDTFVRATAFDLREARSVSNRMMCRMTLRISLEMAIRG